MSGLAGSIVAAVGWTMKAWMLELDAHQAAAWGDPGRAKRSIEGAVEAHRKAVNALVAGLPDRLAEARREAERRDEARRETGGGDGGPL